MDSSLSRLKIEKFKKIEREREKNLKQLLRRYYSLLNEKKKIELAWENVKNEMYSLDYEDKKLDAKILRATMLLIENEYRKKEKKLEIQEKLIKKEIKNTTTLEKVTRVLDKVDFSFKKNILLEFVKKNFPSDLVCFLGLFMGGLITIPREYLSPIAFTTSVLISFTLVTLMRVVEFMNDNEKNPIYKMYNDTYELIRKNITNWFEKSTQK
ncbi:MAG: hypothetical protein QXF35_03555 [Candidatus Bilamarchaeaceae archaeon]